MKMSWLRSSSTRDGWAEARASDTKTASRLGIFTHLVGLRSRRFITALRSKLEMPPMNTILDDIMGLTKINYNSCNFNDGLPVTVRFAKMVGEVLVMGSAKGAERQPFKFYV